MKADKRFKIGQIVRVNRGFGTIKKFLSGNEAEVEFWDFDRGDFWSWMYPMKELKELTAKQRGKP